MASSRFLLSAIAIALMVAGAAAQDMQAADARSECTVIAARMQTGPCAKLQDATMKHTAEIEAMDCPALNVFKETMPTADDSCCDDLRAFITVGCSCDPDVLDLISLSGATKANLAAALKMAQSGQCADPAHGGPMVNPCDGTVGCPPAV